MQPLLEPPELLPLLLPELLPLLLPELLPELLPLLLPELLPLLLPELLPLLLPLPEPLPDPPSRSLTPTICAHPSTSRPPSERSVKALVFIRTSPEV